MTRNKFPQIQWTKQDTRRKIYCISNGSITRSRTNLFGFKLSLPIEVDDQLALRVIGHGAAHPVFAIHRVLRSPLAGQLGQIGVVLPHMDTEIAALFRLVGAVGTLMRWLLAATLDILVAPGVDFQRYFLPQ